jgi:hypothetical protein
MTRLRLVPLALIASVCGCSALGGETYYAVDLQQTTLGNNCDIGPTLADDRSTFRVNDVFVTYSGSDGFQYIDIGAVSLAGSEIEGGIEFKGESLDIEFPTGEIKQTTSITQKVEWKPNGSFVDGTMTISESTTYSCDVAVGQCPGDTECSRTTPFTARRLDGVSFEHDPIDG